MLPTASTKLPVKGAAKKEPEKVVERTSNLYRAQMALHSVLQAGKESYKDYRLEANAAELLTDYSTELAVCILEDSAAIAKHRGAPEIEPADINLALVKKFNINLPAGIVDIPRLVLHKEKLGTGANSMKNGGGIGSTGYSHQTRNTQASIYFAPALAPGSPEPRIPPQPAAKAAAPAPQPAPIESGRGARGSKRKAEQH